MRPAVQRRTSTALRGRPVIPWLLVGVAFGLFASVILLGFGFLTRNQSSLEAQATPVLNVLRVPTTTATLEPTSTPVIDQSPSTIAPEAPLPGVLAIGQLVEIGGTGGDGLRIRAQPGLEARIVILGVESEVFEIQAGPEEMDGYQWWFLANPYNSEKTGWAVSLYLQPIETP